MNLARCNTGDAILWRAGIMADVPKLVPRRPF
jgi:hypothetical protein